MKYIIDIDSQSARYTCNVWSVFKYEDGSLSQDCREFASDDKDEFIKFISELKVAPYSTVDNSNIKNDANNDDEKVIEINICEYEHLVLRANKLYRFRIDPNCEKCKKMNVY